MQNNIWRFLAKSLCVCCILAVAFALQFSVSENTDVQPVLFTKADAATHSGKCGDNLSWSLDTSTGVLNITGSGYMNGYDSESDESPSFAPWYSYRKYIKSVNIANEALNIGGYAFYNCSNLTDVKIAGSVTTIWYDAFKNCSSLTNIELTDGLIEIGGSVFSGCSSLTSIEIPDSVKSIGGFTFKGCSKLTSIKLPKSMEIIKEYAFSGFSGLKSIEIPDSVRIIQINAFADCQNLSDVYYNGTKTEWNGISVKDGNTALSNAKIHFAKTNTSTYFGQCGKNVSWSLNTKTGVLNITGSGKMDEYDTFFDDIDERFSYTPWYLYRKCIKTVNIANGVTSIGKNTFFNCSNLKNVKIADSVTSIGEGAFGLCSSLTSIKIPNSVTSIGTQAFFRCTNLKSVEMSNNVTSIGGSAFEHCGSLTNIEIPNSVTSIGGYAFYACESLGNVYYSGTQEEWQKINKGTNNNDLYTATIHYDVKTDIEVPVLSDLKPSANKSQVIVSDKVRVKDILAELVNGVTVSKADGTAVVSSDEYIGTGMKLILKNEKGVIFDEKTVIVPCDIDGDGKVSAADARSALRNSVGLEAFDEAQNKAANAENSNDGEIKASDARIILRAAVGLEDKKSIFDKTA